MDILCPYCGEPWDHDELHGDEFGRTYQHMWKNFKLLGCNAWDKPGASACSHARVVSKDKLLAIQEALDIAAHPDDFASDCSDIDIMMEMAGL